MGVIFFLLCFSTVKLPVLSRNVKCIFAVCTAQMPSLQLLWLEGNDWDLVLQGKAEILHWLSLIIPKFLPPCRW